MCKKAIITGFLGQRLDDKLKAKIENLVKKAVEEYAVTDFYFGNMIEEDFDDEIMNELQKEYKITHEFIAQKIKQYKEKNNAVGINSALVVGQSGDNNYNAEMYDEIIQSYPINFGELENCDIHDAYVLRDRFLSSKVDLIFWYSNKILISKSSLAYEAMSYDKKVIYN